jgi:hypothetical protein
LPLFLALRRRAEMAVGSGRDLNKSEAVERLWAAILAGTLTSNLESSLRNRYEKTAGGASFSAVVGWLQELGIRFPLSVVSATRTPPNINGDVDATLGDGSSVKFEVKAQVKKPAFADITQSDWIRDQTDLLSRFVATVPAVNAHFSAVGASELAGESVDPNWSESNLHLADLSGITDAGARQQSGVSSPVDLSSFIDRKWFLHVTGEGARLCRFRELAPIKYLLDGGSPVWQTKVNPKGRALRFQSPDGKTWFTYHLYPHPTIKGRHKMHVAALSGVMWV